MPFRPVISPGMWLIMTTYQSRTKKQLKITGGQLIKDGILQPSPQLGETLSYLEKAVVDAKVANTQPALISATKSFINEDD